MMFVSFLHEKIENRGRSARFRNTVLILSAALAILAGALPSRSETAGDPAAEQAVPPGGFTFKRVRPPSAQATRRIDIQVERTWPYNDTPRSRLPAEPEAGAPDAPDPLAWFWGAVPRDIESAAPDRLHVALDALRAAPAGLAPSPKLLDRILREQGPRILAATAGRNVSPALVLAVIAVESAGEVKAKSPKGAQGLMQLIPATAARFGVRDSEDPEQNIAGGAAYLDQLLGQFRRDPVLALAAYNAGEGAVISNGGVPPYAETRAYVPKVIAAWDKARLYCITMPRYADDGCVFALDRSLVR